MEPSKELLNDQTEDPNEEIGLDEADQVSGGGTYGADGSSGV